MALPLVALLPWLVGAIKSAAVVSLAWIVKHYFLLKLFFLTVVIYTCARIALGFYVKLLDTVFETMSVAGDKLGEVATLDITIGEFLAKANYVLPVSELFYLVGVFLSVYVSCLTANFLMWCWKAIPFKAA